VFTTFPEPVLLSLLPASNNLHQDPDRFEKDFFTMVKLVTSIALFVAIETTLAFHPITPLRSKIQQQYRNTLYASSGAPKYDKVDAILESAEELAEGSVLLHVNTGTDRVDYQPGHVLAFEMKAQNSSSLTGKTAEDAEKNEGWMRGPFTVSRATEHSFDILIKVVGEKSREFAAAKQGTQVRFGGKFKVPILEGIQKNNTKRVVLLSTGVGVGPCVGALEGALQDESFPPISLVANYRTASEVVYEAYLNELAIKNSDRFQYFPFITSERGGRLSDSEENMEVIKSAASGLTDTHYHLIGNGQMVKEWQEGLGKAGVPNDKITTEMYFNHREPVREKVPEAIASSMNTDVFVPTTKE